MSETTLTVDGSYAIDNYPTETAAVALSGSFGGGTVTIKIKQGAVGTDLVLDTVTTAYAQEVKVGMGNTLTITLASSTSPSLLVQVIPLRGN